MSSPGFLGAGKKRGRKIQGAGMDNYSPNAEKPMKGEKGELSESGGNKRASQ